MTVSGLILLGALLVPFFLLSAIIRGGLRGRRERAAQKRLSKEFE